MKRYIPPAVKSILTVIIAGLCIGVAGKLEYWQQLAYVDNLIGWAPFVLLLGITVMLITLVWKPHKTRMTWTIVLSVLTVLWGVLLVPAVTGNWYSLAKEFPLAEQSPYAPAADNIQTAQLPKPAALALAAPLPKLDGATALYPVYMSFANAVYANVEMAEDTVVCTNTPNAYRSVMQGACDIIFVAGPSQQQKRTAEEMGAELVYTPIGKEAFVFLVGKSNPISGLTQQQLKNIYSGKTAHWATLGWQAGGDIIAFQRPEGSGSQTGLQNMMGGLPIQKPRPLPDSGLLGQGSMMQQVSVEWQGVQPAIGYSYRYYANTMYPNADTKLLAIDGVYPSKETIRDGSYPFSANFYAVTNGQPTGNVKALLDWILSEEGQCLIEQVGYVPIR